LILYTRYLYINTIHYKKKKICKANIVIFVSIKDFLYAILAIHAKHKYQFRSFLYHYICKLRINLISQYFPLFCRKQINRSQLNPICLLCENGEETLEHFLLTCNCLDGIRAPLVKDIIKNLHRGSKCSLMMLVNSPLLE
jgi:hypothetical protein